MTSVRLHFPRFKAGAWSAVLAVCVLSGCGYTTKSSLDPMYQTIAVSPFYDQSPEYDLQAPLSNALVRKFITDARLRVVKPEEADLLLEGVILDLHRKGLTHDQNDEVTQSLLVVTAAVRLTDVKTGEVVWEDPLMAGETSFNTKAAGISSDRLRGNAEVYLATVRSFATEEENRAASEALEQLASDIFYRVVEPW
ncbi:MAG: LptE family protein [Candidatus Hydrogenedentes bacterium]|nr:LptE family protein [Candidatus Hydrogenedentota bacterium]